MSGDRDWERPSRWRRWVLRLLALIALAAVVFGLYSIYQAAIEDDEPASSGVDTELQAIVNPAAELADALEDLDPDSRNRTGARRAAVRAITATRAARRAFDATGTADTTRGERVGNGIDAEREYLNAISAVLKDPASRLRQQVADRAGRARRALDAMPDDFGLTDEIRGVQPLLAWARAND